MAKLNQQTLKQHLNHLSREELVDEIGALFDKFTKVKEYYQIKLGGGSGREVLEKYKAVIGKEFNPPHGLPKARLSVAKKAVSDFKKISNSPVDLADLMLAYVEAGVGFTMEFGDIDEPFYISMETMFEKAAVHITKHKLRDQFEPRCRKIVRDTGDMGWGFHDQLNETCDEYFRVTPAQFDAKIGQAKIRSQNPTCKTVARFRTKEFSQQASARWTEKILRKERITIRWR